MILSFARRPGGRALAALVLLAQAFGLPAVRAQAQDRLGPPAPWTEADGPRWLQPSYAPQALRWVAAQDARTLHILKADPRFARFQAEAEAVLTDPGRVPEAEVIGDEAFEYRHGRDHPQGLWRRSPAAAYFAGAPRWRTALDLDALSRAEGRRWFFDGAECRKRRCLVRLMDNGKDAHVVREFDLDANAFVPGGFSVPQSKSEVWWLDDDALLIAPALAPDQLDAAGLPRTLRLWKRGQPLGQARLLFTGDVRDAEVRAMLVRADGLDGFVAARGLDFNTSAYTFVRLSGGTTPLPLPPRAESYGVHDGRLLMRLDEAWTPPGGARLEPGTLIAIPLAPLLREGRVSGVKTLYVPHGDEEIRGVTPAGGKLYLELLRDYRSVVVELSVDGSFRKIPLEQDAFISVLGWREGRLFVRIEAPLRPERLALVDPATGAERTLYRRPPAFDARGLVAELSHVKSRDGTDIAYTVMRRANLKLDGSAPTLVYGYGGYDVPVTPRYEPIFGKLWLEKGGVYVHAYLRGGGERGPAFHRGAMRRNRQQPYDDMAAVLADLQRRGITSPAHTGIMGRSNGGLMAAAMLEEHPDLMNAAVIGGPLTDMLHFEELPPGASWTAEYGDPRDPAMRPFLAGYSPLQNIRRGARYPTPLVITATDDDRVLPGHARRFAARMQALGHDALYFEDDEGGHYWELAGGPLPGDWRRRAVARAVEFTYLWERLGGGGPASRAPAPPAKAR